MAVKDTVSTLIAPALKVIGYDLANVSFRKEGSNFVLRVVIDKDGPVGMDDIVRAGDLISPLLDEADPIQTSYMLDVTSLGVEKPIEIDKLEKYVGEFVQLTLREAVVKKSEHQGTLKTVTSEEVILELDNKKKGTLTILRSNLSRARLAIKF
ncbi:MAG: ribosome maturation factor RimP [Bacilli bacterium]